MCPLHKVPNIRVLPMISFPASSGWPQVQFLRRSWPMANTGRKHVPWMSNSVFRANIAAEYQKPSILVSPFRNQNFNAKVKRCVTNLTLFASMMPWACVRNSQPTEANLIPFNINCRRSVGETKSSVLFQSIKAFPAPRCLSSHCCSIWPTGSEHRISQWLLAESCSCVLRLVWQLERRYCDHYPARSH